MTSPGDVARFHARYDRHPDDRIRLFRVIADVVPPSTPVLYPGSYIDIAPSIWFDDVTYVDTDARAARFFSQTDDVAALITTKRRSAGAPPTKPAVAFLHLDYRRPLPIETGSFGLLVSLFAEFVSEHCTDALAIGGTLLVNPSHGDAAMASIDSRYELTGTVTARDGDYRIRTADLDTYLIPKRPQVITIGSLHHGGRGIGYTRSPFAYLFKRIA